MRLVMQNYGEENHQSILEYRGAKVCPCVSLACIAPPLHAHATSHVLPFPCPQVALTVRTEKQEALNVYMPKAKAGQTKPIIRAPMSGKLVSISVRRGDHVCTDSRLWFDRLVSLHSFSLRR